MVCLPKPGKVADLSVKVSDTRPISVMSVWWRLWASTFCKSSHLRQWLQTVLLPEVGGISHEDIYSNLIEIFDHFTEHGYLLTLDYSKAFDCIDASLSHELLRAHGWPSRIISLLSATSQLQCRFVQWDHHTHPDPLNASQIQPQGDPFGPLMMSLWVQAGILAVRRDCPLQHSSTKVYLDDRTMTASSAQDLAQLHRAWKSWSLQVGLLENDSKTKVTANSPAKRSIASAHFPQDTVESCVQVLGSVSASGRRRLAESEVKRVAEARKVTLLLGCCRFLLDRHLRLVRQFAVPKVNFGWVARGPTWSVSKSLFSSVWRSARRVRYSSPWLRALFLGGNLHLDVVWATRLVASVLRFRLSKGFGPMWTRSAGSCAGALRGWMSRKGFLEDAGRPWVWSHAFAGVSVNLARGVTQHTVVSLIGLAQHNVRQGWRAWVFQRWLESGRHELRSLPPLSGAVFRSLQVEDIRSWALSAAPAATVALGATFSVGHWSVLPAPVGQSGSCPRGCGGVGFWDHVCWSCPRRPSTAPLRPSCPLLARFGWTTQDSLRNAPNVTQVRSWLLECQNLLWLQKEAPSQAQPSQDGTPFAYSRG